MEISLLHTRRECRVKYIDVYADVDLCSGHSSLQTLNHTRDTITIKVSGLDYLETASLVVPQISFGSDHRRSDARMDGCVADQAFLVRDMKECAMVYPTDVRLVNDLCISLASAWVTYA